MGRMMYFIIAGLVYYRLFLPLAFTIITNIYTRIGLNSSQAGLFTNLLIFPFVLAPIFIVRSQYKKGRNN